MTENAPFATLRVSRLSWAVGAVHGEARKLRALHVALSRKINPGDYLIYTGNVLGRGPAVGEAMFEMLSFRRYFIARPGVEPGDVIFLRGGQEEMWERTLDLHRARAPAPVMEWMLRHGLGATLAAYGAAAEDAMEAAQAGGEKLRRWVAVLRATMAARDGCASFMDALVHYAKTEHDTLMFVNSGINPERALDEQGDAFWWGGPLFDELTSFYKGGTRVIRGYDPKRRSVASHEGWATIDSGCGFGGGLTAACFDPAGNQVDVIQV